MPDSAVSTGPGVARQGLRGPRLRKQRADTTLLRRHQRDNALGFIHERAQIRDGVADAQVDAIINSQASRAERLHYADYIIDNNHDFSATKEQVSAIMRDLTLKY